MSFLINSLDSELLASYLLGYGGKTSLNINGVI